MNYSTEIDPYLKIICFPSFEGGALRMYSFQ